ncbi:MAG: FtsX-like permease family protein [Thermoleophilaceae bacterium]
MPAVRMRLRAELRTRWRAWLALAVLAGLGAGLVIATAAGARRTDDAVARYRAAVGVFDVWVGRNELSAAAFARVEKLPQVARAIRSFDVAFWGRTDAGRAVTVNDVELNAPINGPEAGHERTKYLSGRPPDPARADEIYVGARAAEANDLQVGSTLRVRVATPRELGKFTDTSRLRAGADPETTGTGPLLTLRVVGVTAEVLSEDALAFTSLSRGFYETYRRRVGLWYELTAIRLKRGDADLDAFRAGVERLAGGKQFAFQPYRSFTAKLQSSIDLQTQALLVLAVLGGLAVLVLVGQALTRQAALESSEHPLLLSLGMTHRQLFALGMMRVAPVSLAAGALALGVAVALSPLAPIGVARWAEPDPGLALDPPLVGGGAVATTALVLLAALVPAWRASRTRPHDARRRSSATVGFLARTGFPASGVSGVRMALEPGRGRTAVPVRSTLLAAIVAVAAVAATFTITESADHLLDTPRLYGHNWDAVIGPGAGSSYADPFVTRLRADRSIAELTAGTVDEIRIGGKATGVLAMKSIRGALSPTVLEGRAPAGSREILLGTKTAGTLAAEIGDTVEGRIGDRASAFRVVGRGVLPDFAISGSGPLAFGNGVAMTAEGMRRLDPRAPRNLLLLGLAPTAEAPATLARLQREASATPPPRPADVGNWGRVDAFPYLAAALIGVGAAALLAQALITSIRRRDRDLAIFKTLGFERRAMRATVAWQASTVAAIGVLVGLPLGVGLGRFGWNLFAAELGVVPEPMAPAWSALLVIPAALLLANLVALVPAAIAARIRPALVLRAE